MQFSNIYIYGGTINAATGDDGVHADDLLTELQCTESSSESIVMFPSLIISILPALIPFLLSDVSSVVVVVLLLLKPKPPRPISILSICVCVVAGDININAGSDGIKSTYDTDTTKGNVIIEGGNITIKASNDGIQAENILVKIGRAHV